MFRKVIDGKVYDVLTSQQIGEYETTSLYSDDFDYEKFTLHRTKKGALFLHGLGGAATRWRVQLESRRWCNREEHTIIVLSDSEALSIVEEHFYDQYKVFFAAEEA